MVSSAGQPSLAKWLLLFVFFVAFILFFVSYCGNSWYVVPVENNFYPPENPVVETNFGLFWLCYKGHCKYDLRTDYMIMPLLPYPDLQFAYQHYRVTCMAIETVSAIFCIFTLALYFIYLANFSFSHYVGFAAGGLGIIAGVISLIGVIIFGKTFRGSTQHIPFGWSLGLMVSAFVLLIANGIATVLLTAGFHVNLQRKHNASETRPLAFGT